MQRKLDGLVEQFDADNIDAEQFGAASRKTRAKLAEVDRQLADATRTSPAAALVAAGADAWEAWQAMSMTQRALAVEELMTVTVLPAARRGEKFQRVRSYRMAARAAVRVAASRRHAPPWPIAPGTAFFSALSARGGPARDELGRRDTPFCLSRFR